LNDVDYVCLAAIKSIVEGKQGKEGQSDTPKGNKSQEECG